MKLRHKITRFKLSHLVTLCFTLVGQHLISSEHDDLIVSIEAIHNNLKVSINEEFKSAYLLDDFFVEYDPDIDLTILDTSIVTIPFILNVMPIIWISGKNYFIDSMDEDLYHALIKIKAIYQRMYSLTAWNGTLTPRKLVKNQSTATLKDPKNHVALLYSGGLDSTCSSYYHSNRKQLLITAWGQWDIPLDRPELWERRKKSFIDHATHFGYTNAFIRSNYVDFLNWNALTKVSPELSSWRVDTTEGLGMMGLSIPILMIKGYTTLLISSSFTWDYPYPTAANPFIDDNIRIAGAFRLKHDHFELNRLDKIKFLIENCKEKGVEFPLLKVCDGQRSNNCCDDCNKCIPTILALLALNEDPQKYGFEITAEAAIVRAQEYCNDPESYFSLWNIMCVRKMLFEQFHAGITVPPSLMWLLETSFWQASYPDVKERNKVVWPEYADLAAEDLQIPSYERAELY